MNDLEMLAKARAMPAEEAEEFLITMERLRRWEETGLSVSLEAFREWIEARKLDPDAPCPKPETSG
jgi:hypothetical protein